MQPAARQLFVCTINSAGRAALPPLLPCSPGLAEPGCARHPAGPGALGAAGTGRAREKGMQRERGLCPRGVRGRQGSQRCARLRQTCPAAVATGEARSGDTLSILQPSPGDWLRSGVAEGRQRGSGSASACSASRLPLSPSPPLHPCCVWQLSTEASGSGWRTARTPGSLGCWLFLLLAAGRARLQA